MSHAFWWKSREQVWWQKSREQVCLVLTWHPLFDTDFIHFLHYYHFWYWLKSFKNITLHYTQQLKYVPSSFTFHFYACHFNVSIIVKTEVFPANMQNIVIAFFNLCQLRVPRHVIGTFCYNVFLENFLLRTG